MTQNDHEKSKVADTVADKTDLHTMRVVDVPEKFGIEGLYRRFEASLERHGLAENIEIWRAMRISSDVHAHDTRTNGHYFEHIMIVGLQIVEDFGIDDPKVIAAGILHDTVEDHPINLVARITGEDIRGDDPHTSRQKAYDALASESKEVADMVLDVSNPIIDKDEQGRPLQDKLVVYTEHTRELLANPKKAKSAVVKTADFIHNAVNNHLTLGPKRHRLDEKYIMQYEAYTDYIFSAHSPFAPERRQEIAYEIWEGYGRAIERLEADEKDARNEQRVATLARIATKIAAAPKAALRHVPKIGSKDTDSSPRDDTEPQHL